MTKYAKFMVELEFATGEGIVAEYVLPADFPIFTRFYAPFEPDEQGNDWSQKLKGPSYETLWWHFDDDGPVSFSAIPSFERTTEYNGLTVEEAAAKAETLEETVRVVREDGKSFSVGIDVQATGRVNLFVAKGKVYRAEYF